MQTACRYGKNNLTNASDEYDFEVKMKKRSNATRCYLSDKSHITAFRKAITKLLFTVDIAKNMCHVAFIRILFVTLHKYSLLWTCKDKNRK